jgi:hypothetical protein
VAPFNIAFGTLVANEEVEAEDVIGSIEEDIIVLF